MCSACGASKPASEFPPRRATCRTCTNERLRAWQLNKSYGLSVPDYETILAHQGGVCAICKRPPKAKRLAVDHDHKTGLVRGLLCWACNSFLGKIRDSPVIAENAAQYLHNPPSTIALGEARQGVVGPVRKRKRKRKSHG